MINFPGDDPRGRELRLIIERAKYERFVIGEVHALLNREFNRLADLILSGRYRTLTIAQRQRMQHLFREIAKRIGAGYQDVTTLVLREMRGYAQLEAEVARLQAASTLAGPVRISLGVMLPKTYLEAIAKLPIQGLKLGDWFDAQAQTMTRETKRIIQQGLIEGKGPAEISRRIVADQRTQGAVLSRRAKSEAASISRTTVNAVQNDAAIASYMKLPDSVSDSYRLLIVRDTRTSEICLGLAISGKIVYRYDDPKRKVPPLHVGCRTGVQPIVKGAEQSVQEQRSATMTFASYGDWLKVQSVTDQNTLLGAGRADLWRSGRMTLKEAVDDDGRLFTLKELRASLGLAAK